MDWVLGLPKSTHAHEVGPLREKRPYQAEGEGFEPSIRLRRITVFETALK